MPNKERRHEQPGEEVGEHKPTARPQDSGALFQTSLLVRPVIERVRTDDKVEAAVRIRELFSDSYRKPQAIVAGNSLSSPDHRGSRIDTDQVRCFWNASRELAKQIPAPAPDVEDTTWCRLGVQGQVCCAVGDLVVPPAAPTALVCLRTPVERSNVSITSHRLILPATRSSGMGAGFLGSSQTQRPGANVLPLFKNGPSVARSEVHDR
ncbi:MAG TPA: hypothetical protein VED84_02365 [Acidimicrobiales bacterium]|nr:hypothetical protein [Acidimicrobiales bacterium]